MTNARSLVLSLLVGLLVPTARLAAQHPRSRIEVAPDSTTIQEIRLKGGTTLIGRITRIAGADVDVRTIGGLEVTVPWGDIVRVRRLRGAVHGGEFWERDPSDSRLFLGPTARVPPHGHGYAGAYELFFASFGVGVGGVGMISAGVSLFPGLDLHDQVFYVAPKLQVFDVGMVQGAAGVFWIQPGWSEGSAGLVFGGLTGGSDRASLTSGIGFPFASEGGFADEVLVLLGGEIRATSVLKVMTENWIVPGEDGAILSLGLRFIARTMTVEVGAATSTAGGGLLPIVNVSAGW